MSEAPEVFTAPWCDAARAALEGQEAFRAAAAAWPGGAVVLEMAADAAHGIGAERAVWLELGGGGRPVAHVSSAVERAGAPYLLRADPATWKRLLSGEIDPVSAVMGGRLRLVRGDLFTLAKHAAMARELVAAAAAAGGVFPRAEEAGL